MGFKVQEQTLAEEYEVVTLHKVHSKKYTSFMFNQHCERAAQREAQDDHIWLSSDNYFILLINY